MARSPGARSASTAVLAVAALISASAVSGTIGSGFQPLLLAVCLLPLQCAALLWAWQRSPG